MREKPTNSTSFHCDVILHHLFQEPLEGRTLRDRIGLKGCETSVRKFDERASSHQSWSQRRSRSAGFDGPTLRPTKRHNNFLFILEMIGEIWACLSDLLSKSLQTFWRTAVAHVCRMLNYCFMGHLAYLTIVLWKNGWITFFSQNWFCIFILTWTSHSLISRIEWIFPKKPS